LAQKDKERYYNEKRLYNMIPHPNFQKKPRKKRAKKDPTAPKRNMSAYLFFSNMQRAELKRKHPEMTFTEITKTLSNTWKKMSSEQKRVPLIHISHSIYHLSTSIEPIHILSYHTTFVLYENIVIIS
jgi:hypothetical protein